jgi:thymidylate synthase ThyX
MPFKAQVILDSVGPSGQTLTTSVLQYPRFIHAEFMTHREFSRNASSSRAIPVKKVIEQVRNDPAMPVHWGANQAGMQAGGEISYHLKEEAIGTWIDAAYKAADAAETLMELGLHKQVANRLLEPFQWMHVVVTTVKHSNFDGLRDHTDADPNIQLLAQVWKKERSMSRAQKLDIGEWHLPFIDPQDRLAATQLCQEGRITRDMPKNSEIDEVLKKISAARCARVSYLNHEGKRPSIEEDIKLFERLVTAEIIHASPTEHQATPDILYYDDAYMCNAFENPGLHGNLPGWIQFRKTLKNEYIR